MSNIINAFGQPADGKPPEEELEPDTMELDPETPIGFLAAHTAMIDGKRAERVKAETGPDLNPDRAARQMQVCRVDGRQDENPTILLMLMDGGRTSVLVAGTDPSEASDVVTTIHDGNEMRVEMGGAVGLHLSGGSCFRIACQFLENLLPDMKPEVRAAADKFLEVVRD